MLTCQPERLQHSEKFPSRYTVTPLQHLVKPACANTSKMQGKQKKQQMTRVPANQLTLDQFIAPGGTQTNSGETAALVNADAAASIDNTIPFLNFHNPEVGIEPQPQGWD